MTIECVGEGMAAFRCVPDERGGLAWFCPNCALETDENFCVQCGRKLTRADLAPQAAAEAARPHPHTDGTAA